MNTSDPLKSGSIESSSQIPEQIKKEKTTLESKVEQISTQKITKNVSQETVEKLKDKSKVEQIQFGKSKYIEAFGKLSRGDVSSAKKVLEELAKGEKDLESGVEIDVEASLEAMVKYFKENPYTDLRSSYVDQMKKNPYIDSDYKSMHKDKQQFEGKNLESPLSPIGKATEEDLKDVSFESGEKLGLHELSNMSDFEIFDKAIPVDIDEKTLEKGEKSISYNNVEYGGGSPAVKLQFSLKLGNVHNKMSRLDSLEKILKKHDLPPMELEDHTATSLIHSIASHIDKSDLTDKEALVEQIVSEVVVALVGSADSSDQYLLQFKGDTKPLARDYFHFGSQGSLLNGFFANIKFKLDKDEKKDITSRGSMSTDLFIKQGGADCRGTNCIYATLLNIGYKEISSNKEAKILYVKVQDGMSKEKFLKEKPADHNIVLVTEKGKSKVDCEVKVMDAFFSRYNNQPLRKLVDGCIVQDGMIAHISGANKYPAEQFAPKQMTQETVKN